MKTIILASALFATMLTTSTAFAATEPTDDKKTAKAAAVQVSAFRTVDNKIRINIEKQAFTPAMLEVRNAKGELIFTERIAKKQTKIATRMDMSNLEDGVYEVRVVSNANTFSQKVTLSTREFKYERQLSVN